jgi:DNA-binding winged helix-turn-helix (wHTH) protein
MRSRAAGPSTRSATVPRVTLLSYSAPERARFRIFLRDSDLWEFEAVRTIDRLEHSDVVVLPTDLVAELSTEAPYVFTACRVLVYGPATLLPKAYLAGASDFMKEPWETSELGFRVARLTEVARPTEANPPSHSDAEEAAFEATAQEANALTLLRLEPGGIRRGRELLQLNEEEFQVLRLFFNAEDRTVSRRALAFVMGLETGPESRAVDMRIARLRRRLQELLPEEERDHNPIIPVRKRGYRLVLERSTACG